MPRSGRLARSSAAALCAVAAFVLASSCATATQITVELSAKEGCSALNGASVLLGEPAADGGPIAWNAEASNACEHAEGAANVGTLVVTPGPSRKGFTLLAVAGVAVPSSACSAANDWAGCIVARRRLVHRDHASLRVPIRFDLACTGVRCDPESTCYEGRCLPSDVACAGERCDLSALVPADGGAADGGPSDAAPADGAVADAGPCVRPADASVSPATIDGASVAAAIPSARAGCNTGGSFCNYALLGAFQLPPCSTIDDAIAAADTVNQSGQVLAMQPDMTRAQTSMSSPFRYGTLLAAMDALAKDTALVARQASQPIQCQGCTAFDDHWVVFYPGTGVVIVLSGSYGYG
jgi:hypothetical protein